MDNSFEDSFEELSDEYLSEDDLIREIAAHGKATQRKGKPPQKNAKIILEN